MTDKNHNREKIWQDIERYLNGAMHPEEESVFKTAMEFDPELKAEVELHRQIHETLGNEEDLRFRSTLKITSQQYHRKGTGNQRFIARPLWAVIAVAASVLILLGIFFWIDTDGQGDVVASNFEAYPMVLTERSAADTANVAIALNEAIREYQAGNYTAAANGFRQVRESGMDEITVRFYDAVSLLGAGKSKEAAELFRQLLSSNGHLLEQQSRWYLGLALWQSGNEKEAITVFESIKPGQYKYDRAQEIRGN